MGWMFDNGRLIGWLQKPAEGYEPFTPNDSTALRDPLRPGAVLLVEGNNHISGVIKNIINLMRYVFPWPVTQRRRRRMITLGSGDATMSYDLRVRSQAHYLLARSVVDFFGRMAGSRFPKMLAANAAKPISGDIQLRLRLFVSMACNSHYAAKQSLSCWLMAVWGTLGCSTSELTARRGVVVGLANASLPAWRLAFHLRWCVLCRTWNCFSFRDPARPSSGTCTCQRIGQGLSCAAA
jgi:hypothetical protein